MPESAAHDHALRAADLAALGRWDAAQSLALTAIALHLTEPEPSPVSTGDDSGLDLPPGVTVKPISWTVTDHDKRRTHYVTEQFDGSFYAPAARAGFPTLAEAVAATLPGAES